MSEIVTFKGLVTSSTTGSELDETRVANFLIMVGDRVRKARSRMGISRRVLSEKSGVSQRYLAQLETGQGNISIGLLLRIADALDFGVEWLVGHDDPWSSDISKASYLLQTATKKQRQQVFEILEPTKADQNKASRIALIGLRGAGKSTLGKLAAQQLQFPFLELNDEIEESGGMPVTEVFALYGQEGYRLLEHQALERTAATHSSVVLAIAGGIAAQPDTFNYLLGNYHTIWLRAEPEEHMQRVLAQGDERPMGGSPNAMNELRKILTNREEQYCRADVKVDTSNATVKQSLDALVSAIRDRVFFSG